MALSSSREDRQHHTARAIRVDEHRVDRSATAAGGAGPPDARAREALVHYERAIERLKAGDWSGFGAELDALRPLLEALGQPPDNR